MEQSEFRFETVFNPGKGSVLVMLIGTLDEHAVLPNADDFKGMKSIEFDFRGLEFINSIGVTQFIRLNAKLERDLDPEFIFSKTPRFIIDMVNTIEGFLPAKGKIKSFALPIFCERCEKVFTRYQETASFDPEDLSVDKLVKDLECNQFPKCKSDLKFDIMPKLFFRFLNK